MGDLPPARTGPPPGYLGMKDGQSPPLRAQGWSSSMFKYPCYCRKTRSGAEEGMNFTSYMPDALREARAAAARDEVPVGAVLIGADGRVLARAGNRTRELSDPTAHAEILVIRAACAALGSERLPGARLWVTLEPCPMCAAAISAARIETLYYGADDPRMGGVRHGARVFDHPQCHHRPGIVDGISAEESRRLLQDFFRERRDGCNYTK